jgi:hypothetical protein
MLVTSLDLSAVEEGTKVAAHQRDALVGLLGDLQFVLEAMRRLKWHGRFFRHFEPPTIVNGTSAQPVLHETAGKQPFLVYGRPVYGPFENMEFMSKWNACIFLFITFVLDEGYWMGPNQGY